MKPIIFLSAALLYLASGSYAQKNKKFTFYIKSGTYTGKKVNYDGETKFKYGSIGVGFDNKYADGLGTGVIESVGTYTGTWKNGLMDGQGELKELNDASYKGGFSAGNRSGQGAFRYANGNSYDGNFKDNFRNGRGFFKFKSGETYLGEWLNDKRQGIGVAEYTNGNKYDGAWVNDFPYGLGTFYFKDGRKYIGNNSNLVWEGHGSFYFLDSSVYTGEWSNNGKMTGFATITRVGGRVETGYFLDGKKVNSNPREGRKEQVISTVKGKYQGEVLNSLPDGFGKMTYANGDIYNGEWLNGVPHGYGRYFYGDKMIKDGIFKLGDPDNTTTKIHTKALKNGNVIFYGNILVYVMQQNQNTTRLSNGQTLNHDGYVVLFKETTADFDKCPCPNCKNGYVSSSYIVPGGTVETSYKRDVANSTGGKSIREERVTTKTTYQDREYVKQSICGTCNGSGKILCTFMQAARK